MKCTTFTSCDLSDSVWDDCTVCAIAVVDSDTSRLRISKLSAYGADTEDASVFVAYALGNGRKEKP
jgi:hypothetical protein